MKTQSKVARRTFLRRTLAASAAIPLAGIPIILRADNHRVDEANPAAVALGYRHDADSVDTEKYPARSSSATTAGYTRPVMTAGGIAASFPANRSVEKAGAAPGLPAEFRQAVGP